MPNEKPIKDHPNQKKFPDVEDLRLDRSPPPEAPPSDPKTDKLLAMLGGKMSKEEMQLVLMARATKMLKEIMNP